MVADEDRANYRELIRRLDAFLLRPRNTSNRTIDLAPSTFAAGVAQGDLNSRLPTGRGALNRAQALIRVCHGAHLPAATGEERLKKLSGLLEQPKNGSSRNTSRNTGRAETQSRNTGQTLITVVAVFQNLAADRQLLTESACQELSADNAEWTALSGCSMVEAAGGPSLKAAGDLEGGSEPNLFPSTGRFDEERLLVIASGLRGAREVLPLVGRGQDSRIGLSASARSSFDPVGPSTDADRCRYPA